MANQYGVVFNGRRITHPGAYDATDASQTTVISGGSVNTPIIVGTSDAGEPGKVLWFSDANDARKQLRGGDLVTATELMFSPIPEGGGGASVVGVLTVNPTVRATKVNGTLTATAKEYGEGGNRIQTKLEAGTLAGSRKFTAFRWDTEEIEVFDNLGTVIGIQYTGAQVYADVTVTVTTGKATKLETKIGATSGSAVVDLSIDLTNERFTTIEDVVRYINSVSGYSATYVDYNKNYNMRADTLDAVAALDIKTNKYLVAMIGDITKQINEVSNLVTVAVSAIPANYIYSYLAGGVKGTTPASWTTHFDAVKKQFSDVLVVLSGSQAIHAEALAHVHQMEQRQQKQVLFTGGVAGENVLQTKQRAATLNSSRAVLAYPGIFHKNVSDGKTVLAPYFTAAMIAGRVCGVGASEPVTFDHFNLIGLEVDLLTGDPAIDELLNAGVATLERVENGAIRLVQGITTYLGANNPLYREISVRRGSDKVSDTMRKSMEDTFVGKKGLRATASAVNTKAIDVLEQAIKDDEITAYRNIIVRFVGTVVYVDYEVAQVEPINFVLITSHFVRDDVSATLPQQ